MRIGWLVLVTACTSSKSVDGTLVYTEYGTENVRVRDLGNGDDQLIDSGQFGLVSIAPDAKHVGYEGIDEVTKIADRSGAVTVLPGKGCAGPASWVSGTALTYCVAGGSMLLPSLDASPQLISTYGVAVAAAASLVAYVDSQGNVVVENLDGTDQRVLVPSADPTAINPAIDVAGFSPDQGSVLLADHSTYPNAFDIVAIADGSMITVPNAFFGGTPFGSPSFLGASPFSSDGSELLLQSTTNLIAVTLATGATRPIATFGSNQSSGGAAFLDDEHVLWLRVDDESVGDEGAFALSVHVAGPGPTDDLVLDPPGSTRPVLLSIAISPAGYIALPSDVVMIKPDGTVLAENAMDGNGGFVVDNILGVTADGGIVTSSNDGEVSYFDSEGASSSIITTATNTDGLLAPFSAYSTAR